MFFERFAELCAQKKMTPTKVGTILGLSKGTVAYWRKCFANGKAVQPDTITLYKIADYFGASVDYLTGRSDQGPTQLSMLMAETQSQRYSHEVRDATIPTIVENPIFTDKELMLVDAYRRNPDLQQLVDRALGIQTTDNPDNSNS